MMINLGNKLIDNDKTKEELINSVEIKKTTEEDLFDICKTLTKAFDLSSEFEAYSQLINSNALLNESIKLVDKKSGEIYGLLMFCDFPINIGSPINIVEKELSNYLSKYSQVNGHSFIIDERLRGCGLDKKMLFYNKKFLTENYDLIWIGVESSLKSKNYWKRLGFIEVFKIEEATFYLIPLSKKMICEYL